MAATALRLRRSLKLTSSILINQTHFSSAVQSISEPCTIFISQNRNLKHGLFNVRQAKPIPGNMGLGFKLRGLSTRSSSRYDEMDGDQISPDAILFEGCDYNHWLITMDFPKDPKPTPEQMVDTYVETAARVLGSVEEAKKKIYACSTTTYQGFQVEVSEEESEKFKSLPGVVFVLPDSYIDPVNKEYGGDKYVNGTIIPRPPPVQYGRQGGRYNDRNREYNRPPPRGQFEQNNASGGQGNYQGDRRGPIDYNQAERRNTIPGRQTDFTPPPPSGAYNQGGGTGSYGQGAGGQYGRSYGQGGGGGYGQGAGGQYGQTVAGNYGQGGVGGGYGRGTGAQYGQGGGGNYGQGAGGNYGQGSIGNYGQGVGGQYGQGGGESYGQGTGRQFGQASGGSYGQQAGQQYGQARSGGYGQQAGGQYGQASSGGYGQQAGGQYGQASSGGYGQQAGGQYGQASSGGYGQQAGGPFGQGIGSGSNQSSSQYGGSLNIPQADQRSNVSRQQGNNEAIEDADAFKE